MKTVIITGISGSQLSDYVENCLSIGNQMGGSHWTHFHYGKKMYELDKEKNRISSYKDWEEGILRRNFSLPYLRDITFDQLLITKSEIESEEKNNKVDQVLIISTHATFWDNKTLLPGINPTRLMELDPNMFITLIDDVIDCWDRLLNTGQSKWSDLSPVDILEWREIEIFTTNLLASICGQRNNPKPFYLIEKRYNPEIVVDLILDRKKKKYYRSYPISFVKNQPEVKAEADRIEDELGKKVILFDPMGIQDYDRKSDLKQKYSEWCLNKGFSESDSSWKDIERHLSHQTVSRDHRLIDQSDGIVVYYPELLYYYKKDKKFEEARLVPFSSGVLDEMHYAIQNGKSVYLVWTSEKDAGPFLSKLYNEKFSTVKELLDNFEKIVKISDSN